MRNLAIILAVAVLVTYVFIAVNERQKERAIRLRLPKFRKIDKYEFDKALYQIRETRIKRLKAPERPSNREDFYRDREYLESLKSEPATEAQPIQPPMEELQEQQQQQEENMQGQEMQQGIQQDMTQEQPEEELKPKLRRLPNYQRPLPQDIPQADMNNENM